MSCALVGLASVACVEPLLQSMIDRRRSLQGGWQCRLSTPNATKTKMAGGQGENDSVIGVTWPI
jgi:hypothetical protein